MQAVNTLSGVDSVIRKLKTIISGYSLTNWTEAMRKATEAYNESSHDYLMGSAPEDMKSSPLLQYENDFKVGKQVQHNNEVWRKKAG